MCFPNFYLALDPGGGGGGVRPTALNAMELCIYAMLCFSMCSTLQTQGGILN